MTGEHEGQVKETSSSENAKEESKDEGSLVKGESGLISNLQGKEPKSPSMTDKHLLFH